MHADPLSESLTESEPMLHHCLFFSSYNAPARETGIEGAISSACTGLLFIGDYSLGFACLEPQGPYYGSKGSVGWEELYRGGGGNYSWVD